MIQQILLMKILLPAKDDLIERDTSETGLSHSKMSIRTVLRRIHVSGEIDWLEKDVLDVLQSSVR